MTPPPNQSARATQLNRMPVHPMNHASKKGPPYPYRPHHEIPDLAQLGGHTLTAALTRHNATGSISVTVSSLLASVYMRSACPRREYWADTDGGGEQKGQTVRAHTSIVGRMRPGR